MQDDGLEPPPLGLEIVPLGSVEGALAMRITAALSRRIAVPCRLLDPIPGILLPRLTHRDQLDADKLLDLVEELPRRKGHWTVGLAGQDMGHPIFTFFFGRARLHGQAIVLALPRLHPDFYGLQANPELVAQRAAVEALHELGHVAGLMHCPDNACLMRFCPSVEGIDNRGEIFCGRCAPSLPPAFAPSIAR